MREGFPNGWVEVQLEELILLLESGNRPKGGVRGIMEGIPSLGGEHLNSTGGFDFSNIKYVPLDFFNKMNKGHIQTDDILVVKDGATTGKASFITNEFPYERAVINEHVFLLRCSKQISSSFLFRYLWSEEGQRKILANFQGAAQGGINRRFISNTSVPLAPYNEQQRIAAKLNHIMPKIEEVKERLERIPQIIKRFRQSVLTAAVTGKLTEKWREECLDIESSSDIIEIIRKRRMNNSITQTQAKKIEAIYSLVEENDSNKLPDKWRYAFLVKLCESFQYGTSKKSQKTGEMPVIRMGNLQNGRIDWNDLVYTSAKEDIEKYNLKTGNVLFNRTNSADLVGKTSIYLGEKPAIYAGYLIRINNYEELDSNYLNYALNSQYAKDYYNKVKSDAVNQSNINAQKLGKFEIPLPPLEEQKEIVRKVYKLFAFSDKLEKHYQEAKEKIDKLPQSVLAKAFRGELVPQDPNDEPAEKLLEQIKEEKARLETEMKKTRRTVARKKK